MELPARERVFDVHIHVQPWEMLNPGPRALMEKSVTPEIREATSSAEALLGLLDSQGIEKVCCINYVAPDVMGFTPETNDWILRFTEGSRSRLLPVGSVHPRSTPDVRTETERILDAGIRMVKLHPPHQLLAVNSYLDGHPELAELYEVCQDRRVPVMIHTGTSIFPGARNRYADPMPVDDVAVDFPDLEIVLAHAGRPLFMETAVFLARRHSRVRLDVSGIPPRRLREYLPRLESLHGQVLWGTDWPSPGVRSMRGNVDDFLRLGYPADLVRAVLYENAEGLFPE